MILPLLDSSFDLRSDPRQAPINILICKAEDKYAAFFQKPRSSLVVIDRAILVVLSAVDLDRELDALRVKVQYVVPKSVLAGEVHFVLFQKNMPQDALLFGEVPLVPIFARVLQVAAVVLIHRVSIAMFGE